MNCEAYRILINGYIDQELSDRELQMLKAHLQTCERCLCYLKQMETLQTTLNRYALFQDVPEVSADFAHKVTAQLQEVLEKEHVSLGNRLRTRYRNFVLNIVEKWANSLKTRPFAWTTTMSCFLVLVVGLLFFEVFQRSYQENSIRFEAVAPEAVTQVAQNDSLSKKQEVALLVETSQGQLPDTIEFVDVGEEPFVRVARNDTGLVEDYVYSHVIEVYQDQLVDDAVFVGYVQDAFIQ
jgi:hypothetical protein